MSPFSYKVVHKCPWGGGDKTDRQTQGTNNFSTPKKAKHLEFELLFPKGISFVSHVFRKHHNDGITLKMLYFHVSASPLLLSSHLDRLT